jgi:hypothetical protein
VKGWKNHSKPEYVKAYQQERMEKQGYVAIEGDRLADAIWLWWKNVGNPSGFMAGTLSSSCRLADFLRERGFIVDGTVDEESPVQEG